MLRKYAVRARTPYVVEVRAGLNLARTAPRVRSRRLKEVVRDAFKKYREVLTQAYAFYRRLEELPPFKVSRIAEGDYGIEVEKEYEEVIIKGRVLHLIREGYPKGFLFASDLAQITWCPKRLHLLYTYGKLAGVNATKRLIIGKILHEYILERLEEAEVEVEIASHELGISGRIDALIEKRVLGRPSLIIVEVKTGRSVFFAPLMPRVQLGIYSRILSEKYPEYDIYPVLLRPLREKRMFLPTVLYTHERVVRDLVTLARRIIRDGWSSPVPKAGKLKYRCTSCIYRLLGYCTRRGDLSEYGRLVGLPEACGKCPYYNFCSARVILAGRTVCGFGLSDVRLLPSPYPPTTPASF